MKLNIIQEELNKAITLAAKFASNRSQLPILANILLMATQTKLIVSSTNLEISVSTRVGAKIEEEGELSIPAKIISDLVVNLPHEAISLETDKEQLKVAASGFTSRILGMNSSDFPKIPNSINKNNSVVIPKKELVEALPKVLFSTSTDETRPILTGILFILEKGVLTMVSTDGFRLSRKKIKTTSDRSCRVIIPKNVLAEIIKTTEDVEDVYLDIEEKEKQVVFGVGEIFITSRILEGDYPDYEKIIPQSASIETRVDKEDFFRAVKLASIFARESANVVKIRLQKDKIIVFAESDSSGGQETLVDAKVDGDIGKSFEIAFNYRFLEEFIHSISGEEVNIKFTQQDKAAVFLDSSDGNLLHLIMPVRIQG